MRKIQRVWRGDDAAGKAETLNPFDWVELEADDD